MKHFEKRAFAKIMAVVAELYNRKISSPLLSIYWAALERFDLTDIRRAITQHVNNPDVGQFMPKPADIVRYLEGDNESHALQAWSKVESAIRKIGSYDSIVFDDPIIHVVISDMGGWTKLCSISIDEMPFRSNEFIKRYRGYLNKKSNKYPKYLVGIFEHSNRIIGYGNSENSAPVLVGDECLALGVLSKGCSSSSIPINRYSIKALKYLELDSIEELSYWDEK